MYTMGRSAASNVVYCFTAATGSNVWKQSYLRAETVGYGPLSTPTVVGNEVYTFDEYGQLTCFDATTGAMLWSKTVPAEIGRPDYKYASAPVIEGDLVLLSIDGVGVAVSRTTHEMVWPTGSVAKQEAYTSPVMMTVNGNRAALIQGNGSLCAINPVTGNTLWSTNYSSTISWDMADPVVYGDRIFVYSKGVLQVNSNMTGVSSVWATNSAAVLYSAAPVISSNYAYFFVGAKLSCIDLTNNAVMWSTNSIGNATAQGALTVADGKLIIFANGRLRVAKASPTGYDEEGRAALLVSATDVSNYGYVPPVLCNGRIYVRFKDKLLCYQAGPNPAADTNQNSIADGWEKQYFTNACDAALDSDGDGASNLAEYLAGADPTNKLNALKAEITPVGSTVVVSCQTVMAGGTNYEFRSRYYSLEQADVLAGTGVWQTVSGFTDILGNGGTIRLTNSVPGSNRFYRVSVRLD